MLPSPGIKYLKQIQILTWRLSKGKLLTRETRNNRFIFPPQIIVFGDCRSKYRVSIAQWSSPFLYVLCWFIFRSAVNMTRARPRKLWPSSVRRSGRASVHPGTWTTSRTNSKTVSSSASTYIVHVPRDVSKGRKIKTVLLLDLIFELSIFAVTIFLWISLVLLNHQWTSPIKCGTWSLLLIQCLQIFYLLFYFTLLHYVTLLYVTLL